MYKIIYRDVNSSKKFDVESYSQVSTAKITSYLNPYRPPYTPGGPGDPEWEMRASGAVQSSAFLEPVVDLANEGVSGGLQGFGMDKEDADKAAGIITFAATILISRKLGSGKMVKAPTPSMTGTTGFRYMTEGELNAIKESGMLRGGNPGNTYFTKDLYKSGTHTQQRLSLPTTPTQRVEFEILNNPTMKLNGSKVLPAFNMPGKGAEFMTKDPVWVKIINSQSLK